jgi:protein-S-isoprenylcysteine O-methyltransferase Ste14
MLGAHDAGRLMGQIGKGASMSTEGREDAQTQGGRLPSLGPRGEGWVAIQVILLAGLAACGLRGPRWPRATRPFRLLAALPLLLAGGTLMAGGSRRLGRKLTPFPRPVEDGALENGGAYGLVRHPIYGGVLLLAAGWALVSSPAALLPAALAAPFLEAKRRREEAWLAEQHPGYEDYRHSVPRRFIPFVW